jgi:hypothetical protein
MQTDLFGNKPIKKITKFETALKKYDKETISERIERLKYINTLLPDEYMFGGDPETIFIFDEAKMAFINGQFISTILLSQAYIERRLQIHYNSIGLDTIAKKGLKAILEHAKKNKTVHHFLLPKIDELRKIRNPFVHLKDYEHDYNLSQRIFKNIKEGKFYKDFTEIIYDDSKEAIRLMYAIFLTPLI